MAQHSYHCFLYYHREQEFARTEREFLAYRKLASDYQMASLDFDEDDEEEYEEYEYEDEEHEDDMEWMDTDEAGLEEHEDQRRQRIAVANEFEGFYSLNDD